MKNKQLQQNNELKKIKNDVTLLCTGIFMCIVALVLGIANTLAKEANGSPSTKGWDIWLFLFLFCIPLFIFGAFLIIYSILSYKNVNRPLLTTFGIMTVLLLLAALTILIVMLLMQAS